MPAGKLGADEPIEAAIVQAGYAPQYIVDQCPIGKVYAIVLNRSGELPPDG